LLERMSYDNGRIMPHRRSTEFWRKIRALVEKGLSLNQASKEFGVSYSHLRDRAAVEGWKLTYTHGRGAPRTLDYPDGTRRVEMAKEQARRDTQQAELLLEARVAVIDTKKAELVAQKILAQHSTMMKMALSELVLETIEDLRSPEVRPKDRALAMVALKTVCDRLFGWDREPDIQRMERARTSDQTQVKSYYQYWLEGTPRRQSPEQSISP
jgi:Psq-like protein